MPYLDVLDNVMAPTLATSIPAATIRAEELLNSFGLSGRRHHVPSKLSAGEQQRAALARALLAQPTLVLADEPTGNLDRENSDRVLGHLANYAEGGAAVIMVTHDEGAMATASRRITMEGGQILDDA